MRHWYIVLACMAASVVMTVGCSQQVFLSEKTFADASMLPAAYLETDPNAGAPPIRGETPQPADVEDPNRAPRFVTLQELIAISLENGVASANGANPGSGLVSDAMATFQANTLNNVTDYIRVLALRPATAYNNVEAQLARFDAQWITSMNWTQTDNLVQGLQSFQNGNRAAFSSTLVRALPTGGSTNMSFSTDYQFLSSPPSGAFGVINPFYTTRLRFGFEQPLWRNFGTEINQLLATVPGVTGTTMPPEAAAAFNGQLNGLSNSIITGVQTDGILIARVRFDQERADFERNIAHLLLNVESAYWKLYQAYGRLYSYTEALRIAHRAWRDKLLSFDAGRERKSEFYPLRGQFEEFRGERTKALGEVLEAERNLRGLVGLPVDDGTRLIPVTSPTLSPYRPNWEAALNDALNLRPELVLARQNLKIAQFNMIRAKNILKPDLRFIANYSPLGFGSQLDGNSTFVDGSGTARPSNALRSLSDLDFNDWALGFRFHVPIGRRAEHAAVRNARLGLAQAYYVLKDQEERAKRYLTQQYQKTSEWYQRIQMHRAERKAYAEALNATFSLWKSGADERISTVSLLDAQRRLTIGQLKEYEAITEYQITLAKLEFAKGTMLQHDNIMIAEGPLPEAAQVRAVDNERKRTDALVLRQRPEPVGVPGRLIPHPDQVPQTLPLEFTPETKIDFTPSTGPMPKLAPKQLVPVPEDLPDGAPEGGLPFVPKGQTLPGGQSQQPNDQAVEPQPAENVRPTIDGGDQPQVVPAPVASPKPESVIPALPAAVSPEIKPVSMPNGPPVAPEVVPEVPAMPENQPAVPAVSPKAPPIPVDVPDLPTMLENRPVVPELPNAGPPQPPVMPEIPPAAPAVLPETPMADVPTPGPAPMPMEQPVSLPDLPGVPNLPIP